MKLLQAEAGVNDGKAGLLSAAGLFSKAGVFDKKSESFNILELDPYLLFDARESMLGTLENPTLDLDPATPSTLDVITATRSGTATYTDANGNIATAAADTVRVDYTQGEELTPTKYQNIGYTDFSQSWDTYLGTATLGDGYDGHASLVSSFTGNGQSYHYFESVDGRTYTGSFWARAVSGSGPFRLVHGNSATGSSTLINLTSEWQFFSVQFLGRSGGGSMYFGIGAQNGDQVEIAMPQVEEGTTASDFVANTTGSPKFITGATYGPRVPMILVEPSATNLLEYSEDFSNSYWTKAAVLIESNQIEAPDGTLTGSKLIEEGADATHVLFRAGLTTLGTISIYAKKSDENNRLFQIKRDGGSNSWSWFDLQAGTVEYQTNGVAAIESVGNGWYRCSFTPTNSNGTVVFGLSNGGLGRGEIWLGDGTSGVYIWGAQLEAGSVSTSVIPTSGSTVTRAADNLEITGSDFDFYNASEGTVYAEFLYDHDQTSKYVYSITETGDNEIRSQILASMLRTRYTVNSSHLANLGNTEILKGSLNRAAFSYKTDNFRANLNGGSDTEDFSGTASINPIKLAIGSRGTANHLNGRIRRILYWPYSSDRL